MKYLTAGAEPLPAGGQSSRVDAGEMAPAEIGLPSSATAPQAPIANWSFVLIGCFCSVFAVGGLAMLIVRSLMLQRRLRDGCRQTDGRAAQMLKRLCRRAGVRRRVRLLTSTEFSEPAACGVLQWTIVLPVKLEATLPKDELRSLLAHELAHLVRGDTTWLWIGRVLCCCLAFQPLNFVARRGWRQAAEFLCDDWAVQQGVCRFTLARALAQVAQWRLDTRHFAVVLAAGGGRALLAERVGRLVGNRPQAGLWAARLRQRTLGALTIGMAAAFVCWGPQAVLPTAGAHVDGQNREIRQEDRAAVGGVAAAVSEGEADSWRLLAEELSLLQRELRQVDELLSRRQADSGEVELFTKRIREKAAAVRRRGAALSAAVESEAAVLK